MILAKTIDGYQLIEHNKFAKDGYRMVVATTPWKITHPGLMQKNCDELFEDVEEEWVKVEIDKGKYVGPKYCFKLKKY
jgi:UPF0288 family protein (methanogenesis marker protein 3)